MISDLDNGAGTCHMERYSWASIVRAENHDGRAELSDAYVEALVARRVEKSHVAAVSIMRECRDDVARSLCKGHLRFSLVHEDLKASVAAAILNDERLSNN